MSLLLVIVVLATATIPQAVANDLHDCSLVCPPPQVCSPVHGDNSYICTVCPFAVDGLPSEIFACDRSALTARIVMPHSAELDKVRLLLPIVTASQTSAIPVQVRRPLRRSSRTGATRRAPGTRCARP